jgi:hypothetical protein
MTTWVHVSDGNEESTDWTPKLSVLIDPMAVGGEWAAVAHQSGRGPTLRVAAAPAGIVVDEVLAAVESVWPHLGRRASESIK